MPGHGLDGLGDHGYSRDEFVYPGAEAALQGFEYGLRWCGPIAHGAYDYAAVALLVFDELREDAGGAQVFRGASVDSGQQRLGELADCFIAEVVPD